MEKMVCPHCQKVSYSASSRAFSPCPHCKFRFAVSEEDDGTYLVIDKQLGHMIEIYAARVADDMRVIVDRRQRQRPFDGVDQRRITS